jgi:hypothetical protein
MEEFAIGANLEGAAARGNERERLDALAEFKNFGRQTDGLRRVVSNDAVFDRHLGFHLELLSKNQAIGTSKRGQDSVEAPKGSKSHFFSEPIQALKRSLAKSSNRQMLNALTRFELVRVIR